MTIENYEQVQKTLSALIKVEKKIKSLPLPDLRDTRKRQASYNDRLTSFCTERDRLEDDLHADLVDANLTPMRSSYETVNLKNTHGLGHSYGFKYTPKIPKSFKG